MTTPDQSGDHPPQRAPQMQALEAQLAALRPREDRLDRERLMYLAGQAAAAPNGVRSQRLPLAWAWPTSLGAAAGAAAALLVVALLPASTTSQPASAPADFTRVETWPEADFPRSPAGGLAHVAFRAWLVAGDPASDALPSVPVAVAPLSDGPALTNRSVDDSLL